MPAGLGLGGSSWFFVACGFLGARHRLLEYAFE
jgi:hypothetical protein